MICKFCLWRGECWTHYSGATWCCCTLHVHTTTCTIPTPCIGKKKQASHRNRRFQQPQYTLRIHHNKQRRMICGARCGLKEPVTHTQREPTEIFQQCNMEEGIQPVSHPSIFKHLGYLWAICSGSHPAHKTSPYMCYCEPGYCATTHHIQKTF